MSGARFTKAKGAWVGQRDAPFQASYVVMSLDGVLTQERVLTAGAGIGIVDGGANGPVTISATGVPSYPFIGLTDAANISLDASLGLNFEVTLNVAGATRQLDNPTNPTNGQLIKIRVKQDGVGSRVITFDTKYRFGTDLPSPVLSTLPNYTDYLGFIYHEVDDKWDYVSQVFGFI